jgi:NTE family protein
MLRRSFGEARLEALDRELVVVSTDLYQRAPVYHRLGPVAEAVGASMSVPVLFPPRLSGGRFLVDGSVSDNCPVSVFSEVPEGPVVLVRISPGSPSGSEDDGPTLGETLLRVVQMREPRAPATTAVPTISVRPDTTGVGGLEFHQIDVARQAGRQAGQAVVEALQGLTP